MHEVMCWDVGFEGVDHYGCQTLQHKHGGGMLYCKRNELKKLGYITLRLGILLRS